jgi:hypothetical protein
MTSMRFLVQGSVSHVSELIQLLSEKPKKTQRATFRLGKAFPGGQRISLSAAAHNRWVI